MFWSIFGHYKRVLFSALASRSGLESIATRFAPPIITTQRDFVPIRDALWNPKYQGFLAWCIGRFLDITKGSFFRLLRADLAWKVLPLDLPFRLVPQSVQSEMHSEIQNTKAIALVQSSISGHYKGGLFLTPASITGLESIATRFAFPISTTQRNFVPIRDALRNPNYQGYSLGVLVNFWTLQRGASFGCCEQKSIATRFAFPISTTECVLDALWNDIALVYWSIFGHYNRVLCSALANTSGLESIATRFAFSISTTQCDFIPIRDTLQNPKYQGYSLAGVLVDFWIL